MNTKDGRDLVRGLGAALLLGGLIFGAPIGLLALGANPRRLLPSRGLTLGRLAEWPAHIWDSARWSWLDGHLAPATVAVVAWAGWLVLVGMTVLETAAQLRRGVAVRRDAWTTNPRHVLAGLIAAVLLLTSSNTALASPATGSQIIATADHRPGPETGIGPTPYSASGRSTDTEPELAPRTRTDGLPRYTVIHGDNLWGLAELHLGDGRRYTEIANLNAQRLGHQLGHLEPGWTLVFPADATNLPEQPAPVPRDAREIVVAPGDTLAAIAGRELGDPIAWHELFALNARRSQADGRALRDPDQLLPGWKILVPQHPSSGAAPGERPEPSSPAAPAPPTPSHTDSARSANTPRPASPGDLHSARNEPGARWVTLPSGAIVSLSLAAAVATAAGVVRVRRRRRRHVTGELRPVPPLTPVPSTVAALQRATRQQTPKGVPDGIPDVRASGSWPPGHTVLKGHSAEAERHLDLAEVPGLGLRGPGASAAARALIAATLAADTLHRGEVWLASGKILSDLAIERSSAEAADPCDPAEPVSVHTELTSVPGVRVADGESSVLAQIETEIARRARILADHALDIEIDSARHECDASSDRTTPTDGTVAGHQETEFDQCQADDPAEPLPAVLVVASPEEADRPRWAAVLDRARKLAIHALVLGNDWSSQVTVDSDGSVTDTNDLATSQLTGCRLDTLSTAEGAEIWQTLSAFRSTRDTPGGSVPPPDAKTAEAGEEADSERAPAHVAAGKPVLVRLLGQVSVEVDGKDLVGLRRLSREAIAYLAAHPAGATADLLEEELLPDAALGNRRAQLHTAISHARAALRSATGRAEARFITSCSGRYRLDAELIDSDIWQLADALKAARSADELRERIGALARIVDLCRPGSPLDSVSYEWSEAVTEHWRNQAVDALVALANAEGDTYPERAIDALAVAISWDPYTEQLYQHLIRLQTAAGRGEAASSTFRLLRRRLAEIDAEPDPDTERLLRLARR